MTGALCRTLLTPPLIRKDLADALWAMAIFMFIRLLRLNWSTARVTLAAIAVAFGIEFLKLSDSPWLQSLRATWIGAVLLGRYFHLGDLLRCAAGIAAGIAADAAIGRASNKLA